MSGGAGGLGRRGGERGTRSGRGGGGAGVLAVDGRGLITVDDRQRSTSHPEVYAVGDAAAAFGPDGRPSRMFCQTALPMGFHVANGIADLLTGGTPGPLRLRYAWQNRTSASVGATA